MAGIEKCSVSYQSLCCQYRDSQRILTAPSPRLCRCREVEDAIIVSIVGESIMEIDMRITGKVHTRDNKRKGS